MTEYIKREFSESAQKEKISTGTHINTGDLTLGCERLEGRGKSYVDITLTKEGRERFAGQYVAKQFQTKEEAFDEIEKCDVLDSNGIAVPPTRRYAEIEGKQLIIYTDLSNGGKNQVWSGNNLLAMGETPDLNQEQFDRVLEATSNIEARASEISFKIEADAYFIVKDSQNDVHVVLGDLGWGVKKISKESNTLDVTNKIQANQFLSLALGETNPGSFVDFL